MRKAVKGVLRLGAIAGGLMALPLTINSSGGVAFNEAVCEQQVGTCCRQLDSICNAGGGDHTNHYYKESGPC